MSHLSAELEWAQFLVIMVVGFMLLYDTVLNRQSARKLEGLLVNGKNSWEGMVGSDLGKMALNQGSSMSTCVELGVNSGQACGDDANLLKKSSGRQGFLGGMQAPLYAPSLYGQRDEQRSQNASRLATNYRAQMTENAAAAAPALTEGMDNPVSDYLEGRMVPKLSPY
jgi:hypothetical protein